MLVGLIAELVSGTPPVKVHRYAVALPERFVKSMHVPGQIVFVDAENAADGVVQVFSE